MPIKEWADTFVPGSSLANCIQTVKKTGSMNVDDQNHGKIQAEVQRILGDVDKYEAQEKGSAKRMILPYQSDLETRKEIARHEKELFRIVPEGQKSINQISKEKEQQRLRKIFEQLEFSVSQAFLLFCDSLKTMGVIERRYFLQYLKLGLNERSRMFLQPLRNRYREVSRKEENAAQKKELEEIAEQLSCGSLGVEHFFREMAISYENIHAANSHRTNSKMIDPKLARRAEVFADIMAHLIDDGWAMEIFDGDAIQVHHNWTTAVLAAREKKRTFVVSVLGAQSCGKSTLLNCLFSSDFPVSSGRCTRGAYMQLVNVEAEFRDELGCDSIMIIDSEGLMSRALNSHEFDNELATFVIGLSDLTLVMVKGEGNEMADVLPIAIKVFLSLSKKVVGKQQACHFVHRGMGAEAGAEDHVRVEIAEFVKRLDEKTRTVARQAEEEFTRFTHVLHYNNQTDDTFLPDLLTGNGPMAKINAQYAATLCELKSKILQRVEYVSVKKRTSCTLSDFSERLVDIWTAIKLENFVFSFQDVMTMEKYNELDETIDKRTQNVKRDVRQLLEDETTKLNNMQKEGQLSTIRGQFVGRRSGTTTNVDAAVQDSKRRVSKRLDEETDKMHEWLKHHFECETNCKNGPCQKYASKLKDFKNVFLGKADILNADLSSEIEEKMKTLSRELKADIHVQIVEANMDATIQDRIEQVIRETKGEKPPKGELEQIFANMWREISANMDQIVGGMGEERKNIPQEVEEIIIKLLKKNDQRYRERKLQDIQQVGKVFTVNDEHKKDKGFFSEASLHSIPCSNFLIQS